MQLSDVLLGEVHDLEGARLRVDHS